MATSANTAARWPERHLPANAAVFLRNELVIPAPAEVVWRHLLRAADWHSWYRDASSVHFLSHAGPNLRDRSRFRWKSFGARITSKVHEFEPSTRIAWESTGIGIQSYRTWELAEQPDGSTLVRTEEAQNGWLARLIRVLMPSRMSRRNQSWLEALASRVRTTPSEPASQTLATSEHVPD